MILAALFTSLFLWEQPPNIETTIGQPMRGGLALFDEKRKPNEVQWVQFDLKFEGGHVFVIVDGKFDFIVPNVPYVGRGGSIYPHQACSERFEIGGSSLTCHPRTLLPNTYYNVIVHANAVGVTIWVDGEHFSVLMPDLYPNETISQIAIGSVGDKITIKNIRQGRFVPSQP